MAHMEVSALRLPAEQAALSHGSAGSPSWPALSWSTMLFPMVAFCYCLHDSVFNLNSYVVFFLILISDFYLELEKSVLVAQSCPTPCDSWTIACHAPVSMEFSSQEYGLGILLQGIFPTPCFLFFIFFNFLLFNHFTFS